MLFLLLVQRDRVVEQELFERLLARCVGELLFGEPRREVGLHRGEQLFDVPLLDEVAFAEQVDLPADRALDRVERGVAQVFTVEHLLAAPVDDLALLVHDFVVLEDVLADLEVAVFDRGVARARRPC